MPEENDQKLVSFKFNKGLHVGGKAGNSKKPLVYKGEYRDMDPKDKDVIAWEKIGWIVREEKPKPVK